MALREVPPPAAKADANYEEWFKIEEAATRCKVSQETVRRACRNGYLRHSRIGNRVRIPASALVEWAEAGGKTGYGKAA